jgi:hypothetical protein
LEKNGEEAEVEVKRKQEKETWGGRREVEMKGKIQRGIGVSFHSVRMHMSDIECSFK